METQTAFDLNLAIRRWREDLARSAAFRSENLNELESHLRDSVDRLRARELSDEEAFLVATRRVGNAPRLEQEFGKVNGAAVWLDRCLWVLVAIQVWACIGTASSALLSMASPVGVSLNDLMPGFGLRQIPKDWLQMVLALIFSPFPTALVAALVWRYFIWPKRRGSALFQRLLRQPGALALTFFVFCVAMHLVAIWARQTWYYPTTFANAPFPGLDMRMFLWRLPSFALWAGLTFFVARRRLRSTGA